MNWRILTCLCVAWVIGPTSAKAVDLAKVERRVGQEPAYRTKNPAYCLLVFGPEAKARVWLAFDDTADVLYVDRNGNGDLTDPGEAVAAASRKVVERDELTITIVRFDVGRLTEGDGKTTHTGVVVDLTVYRGRGKAGAFSIPAARVSLTAGRRGKQDGGFGRFAFATRPEKAPILHFDGPLTLGLSRTPHRELQADTGGLALSQPEVDGLRVGQKTELRVTVVTPGLGYDAWVRLVHEAVPKDLHPVAEVEFPNPTDPRQPVRRKYELKERC